MPISICQNTLSRNIKAGRELIEGMAYALASPSFTHQRIVGKLFRFLDEAIEQECKDCTVGIDTDYVINQSTVVQPDVFVACHEIDERLLKTPDAIFEVISDATAEKYEGLKKELYEREGVDFYVIVYPDLKKARIFRLESGKYRNILDATNGIFEFKLRGCLMTLDFSRIWR